MFGFFDAHSNIPPLSEEMALPSSPECHGPMGDCPVRGGVSRGVISSVHVRSQGSDASPPVAILWQLEHIASKKKILNLRHPQCSSSGQRHVIDHCTLSVSLGIHLHVAVHSKLETTKL
eukprot:1177120-Prorocentrum_minimum.AAC.6